MNLADLINLMNAGNRAKSVPAIEGLMTDPSLTPNQLSVLLKMAISLGEVTLVRNIARKLAGKAPDKAVAVLSVAGAMAQVGQLEEAYREVRQFLSVHSATPPIHHFLGTYFMQIGERENAEKHLRKTLKAWPTAGSTWITLANIKTFSKKDKDTGQLLSLVPQVRKTAPENQGPFFYALATALHDCGQHQRAYECYKTGARVMSSINPYSRDSQDQLVADVQRGFTADFFAAQTQRPGYLPSQSDRPIFIVGMPRSGSTLVEQILCAHPAVQDGAELELIKSSLMEFQGWSAEHIEKRQEKLTADDCVWSSLANTYLHLLEERFGREGRIVDKTLNNSRFLGHILLAFPRAKVIWMQRSPRDTAWSVFKSFFSQGVPFGWRFDDIAHYMKHENVLLEHWTRLFPDSILPLPYELLVEEPSRGFQKIAEFTGLTVVPEMETFHRTKRPVTTSSAAQVRRPINHAGIGASRPYMSIVPELARFQTKP